MKPDACLKWRQALKQVEKIESILRKLEKIVILVHKNADLDAIGAALGLASIFNYYGVDSIILAPEGVNKSVKSLLNNLEINLKIRNCSNTLKEKEFDMAVVVDTANPVQLGECIDILEKTDKIFVIDHHTEGTLYKKSLFNIINNKSSSTSEIISLIAWTLDIPLQPEIATLLYAGIQSDSRGFKIVGEYMFEALSYLVSRGADIKIIQKSQRETEQDTSERIAILKALSRMSFSRACRNILITISYVGSFESSAARAMIEAGSDIAVVATDTRDGVRVSIRVSRRAEKIGLFASQIARYIAERYGGEGGGHPTAGVAFIPGQDKTSQLIARELSRSLPGKIGRLCVAARQGVSNG